MGLNEKDLGREYAERANTDLIHSIYTHLRSAYILALLVNEHNLTSVHELMLASIRTMMVRIDNRLKEINKTLAELKNSKKIQK